MNQIIEQIQSAPSLKKFILQETFIIWCIIFTGAILSDQLLSGFINTKEGFFMALYPWVNAGGHSVNNGLTMFSGNIPGVPTDPVRLGYILSLLCTFIVFPTLFFFGLKNRALERLTGAHLPIIRKSTFQFIIGGAITLGAAMPSAPSAIIQYSVSNNLRDGQQLQAIKDVMINEINTISWKLCEYRVLPKELGGGGGSFKECTLKPEYLSSLHGTYSLEIQDSTVVIKGSSKEYANTGVAATLNRDLKLRGWKYSGEFE